MKKLPILFVGLLAATSLAACANRGGSSVAPTSAPTSEPTSAPTSAPSSDSTTSPTPEKTDWTDEEKELIASWSFIELPFYKEAEAFDEETELDILGGAATADDIEAYSLKIEEADGETWTDEEGYDMRLVVTAEDVSYDFDQLIGLDDGVQYRLSVEYYDTKYKEWSQAYTVQQVIYFGTYQGNFALISILPNNVFNAVFGVSFDGTSLYYPSVYEAFTTSPGLEALGELAVKGFDAEYVYPPFERAGDSEDDAIYGVDYSYIMPYVYGDSFFFEMGLCNGQELEREEYLEALDVAGYVFSDELEAYAKETTNGVATIEVTEYEEDFVKLMDGSVMCGYAVVFGFELAE